MSTPDVFHGAAYEFAEKLMGGPVLERQKTVSIGTVAKELVEPNADRVGLIFVNMGAGSVSVALDGTVSTSKGVVLQANGGTLSLVVQFDFTLTAAQWFAASDAGGPYTVYVIEYSRFRRN